jgi:hypothetical protein
VEIDRDVPVLTEDLAGGGDPADDAVKMNASGRMTPSSSATEAMVLIRPLAFILTAVRPTSSWALIWSATSFGSSPPTQPYIRIRSRTWPPRSWCTGVLKCLPAMSQRAWSRPETALARMGPPR